MKLIIPEIPGHALKEETEVALRGTTNHCQRVGILHQLGGVDIIDEIWITEQLVWRVSQPRSLGRHAQRRTIIIKTLPRTQNKRTANPALTSVL